MRGDLAAQVAAADASRRGRTDVGLVFWQAKNGSDARWRHKIGASEFLINGEPTEKFGRGDRVCFAAAGRAGRAATPLPGAGASAIRKLLMR